MEQVPGEIDAAVSELVHTTVDMDYYPENVDTGSHWTYEPSEAVSYHRLLFRHNFCTGVPWLLDGNQRRAIRSGDVSFRHRNEYAYPVNTADKPEAVATISNMGLGKTTFCHSDAGERGST